MKIIIKKRKGNVGMDFEPWRVAYSNSFANAFRQVSCEKVEHVIGKHIYCTADNCYFLYGKRD